MWYYGFVLNKISDYVQYRRFRLRSTTDIKRSRNAMLLSPKSQPKHHQSHLLSTRRFSMINF